MADDIAASLREGLTAIRREVRALEDAPDPGPGLRRVHALSQAATSELRQQLGLLRQAGDDPSEEEPSPATTRSVRRDQALGVAMLILAGVESVLYQLTDAALAASPWSPWSVALTMLAGATVIGRRVALAQVMCLCGLLFVAGSVLGAHVVVGFWFVGAVGSMMWALAVQPHPGAFARLAGAAMVVGIGGSMWVSDRDNMALSLLTLALAWLMGLVVRRQRARTADTRRTARAREQELGEAERVAVNAERAGFARDLHDVTSHAVGLIALQSAAAQVSWPQNPDTAGRCIAVIDETARDALVELGRLGPERSTPTRELTDLQALVTRIRAADTQVELMIEGELPAGSSTMVYRIVQEALTNAVRHAPGAGVRVEVHAGDAEVRVRVSDDGRGATTNIARGFGLVGLEERVALAGGRLFAGAAPAGGFAVEAVLPEPVGTVVP